jgi:hypothetical protein
VLVVLIWIGCTVVRACQVPSTLHEHNNQDSGLTENCLRSAMPKLILMTRSRYEFNPNSEILDPNLDQCCKGPWTNVTQTLKKHGVRSLGWFGRPCSHIMRTDDPTKSASMDCPSKTIHKGEPTACDLRYLDQLEKLDGYRGRTCQVLQPLRFKQSARPWFCTSGVDCY